MLGYTTTINLKERVVKTTFMKETRTWVFNDTTFTLVDALKVAAEDIANQVWEFLASVAQEEESKDGIFYDTTSVPRHG